MARPVDIGTSFVEFPGGTFNELVRGELVRRSLKPPGSQHNFVSAGFGPYLVATIKNSSGADRERGHILGIDGLAIPFAQNPRQVYSVPIVEGVTPATADHLNRFAVLLDRVDAGKLGKAAFRGACWARVDVTDVDHEFATLDDGNADNLISAADGLAKLLATEKAGSAEPLGEQWAIVQFGCCRQLNRVLIWLANQDPNSTEPATLTTYDDIVALYESMGLVVHEVLDEMTDEWTGNIHDYALIYIDTPSTDPSWWTEFEANWTGRIFLISENSSINITDHYTWINDLTVDNGLSAAGNDSLSGEDTSSIGAADLTADITVLHHDRVTTVSGGTTLATSPTSGVWIVRNKVTAGGIVKDWVLSGDSTFFTAQLSAQDNEQFARNLWTVPV